MTIKSKSNIDGKGNIRRFQEIVTSRFSLTFKVQLKLFATGGNICNKNRMLNYVKSKFRLTFYSLH